MAKFKFTPEERKGKAKEAARGWGRTQDMTPLGYAAFREGRKIAKKKKEEEELKKREEEAKKKEGESRELEAKRAKGEKPEKSKGLQRIKLLIVAAVIIALVYVYLAYIR